MPDVGAELLFPILDVNDFSGPRRKFLVTRSGQASTTIEWKWTAK